MDKEYGGEFSVEMIEARRVLKTNIKKIREVEGLSQEAFGKKYGKSMSSISNYETGMSLPSFEFLLTLREQYGFSMEEFITSTDIEITKGGNQGAKAEGTGKNLNKYVGAYFIYLFDTSSVWKFTRFLRTSSNSAAIGSGSSASATWTALFL